MNNIMKKVLFSLAALCVLLTSCQNSKPPVVSDSRVQLTVTIPESTPADDIIYVAGPFTGGETFSVGNPQWKLTRSGSKCNILLDQESFIGGKTLADGFWFVSEQKGREVDASGKELTRTLTPEPGKEYQYVVAAWSK